MNAYDSLMLEAIPIRITRAPSTERGPTEQLRIREAQQALWAMAHRDEPDTDLARLGLVGQKGQQR